MKKRGMIFLLILGILFAVGPGSDQIHAGQYRQYWHDDQVVVGDAFSSWSFITIWVLEGEMEGFIQISPSWYNGPYHYQHAHDWNYAWTARFIYNQNDGRTRGLMWAYTQHFIQ